MKAEWTNKDSLTSGETTKAILVVDKPIDCQRCLCNDYEEGYCKAYGDGRTKVCDWNSDAIPQWCPLKPMPQKIDISEDAIPIGYIDQVVEEYSHLIECYLYEDNDDYKTMLYYRNALNDLKRRWKRDRPKLHI